MCCLTPSIFQPRDHTKVPEKIPTLTYKESIDDELRIKDREMSCGFQNVQIFNHSSVLQIWSTKRMKLLRIIMGLLIIYNDMLEQLSIHSFPLHHKYYIS